MLSAGTLSPRSGAPSRWSRYRAGLRRRPAVTAALLVAALAVPAAAVAVQVAIRDRTAVVPLDSGTIAVTGPRQRVVVDDAGTTSGGSALLPGSRALDPATAAAQQAWLDAGTIPGAGTRWQPMARIALLDLHALTLPGGAAVAGWSPIWRFVWPRDASFTAAAYARTGHLADAEAVLAFLQQVQSPDGTFQARYRPDGSGPPDARGTELDGSGWVLWGVAQVAAAQPNPAARTAFVRRVAALVTRSAHACLRSLSTPSGLPPAARDYWETTESVLTLGTVAPLLAGLRAASPLATDLADPALAASTARAATSLDATIRGRFGPAGYPRRLGGDARDAAVTFLLPPFADPASPADPRLTQAWLQAQSELRRPGGGLAPGADWKSDGVSWTPETALFALSAASTGRHDLAAGWLDWLDRHRTAQGSLPEKVTADGRPAAVAPLAWTAASVLLALSA